MSAEDEHILPDTDSLDVKQEAEDVLPEAEQNNTNNTSRMDSAKAFFRAMYAGEEVDAGQYGMKVDTVNPAAGTSGCSNCEQLVGEMEQLGAKASEIEGLYKRMAADFDNYRKRVDREREELVSIGVQRAVETLLPALDDLDRAQANFNHNSDPANLVESLKLISGRFAKCLETLGIKPLETIGQPFDPRLHEPVQQIPTAEVPEGAVAHDLRRGYSMGEKVIRPALVNVASNSQDRSSEGEGEPADLSESDNQSD